MVCRLILIAHAETDATRRGAFPDDQGLTARGAAAAARMAVPSHGLALVAPGRAARETAVGLGLAAGVEPALRDLDVGDWRGRTAACIGEAMAAFVTDPSFACHGGESIGALCARVGAWLDSQRSARGTIAAVTHASVARAALIATLGAPVTAFWTIDVGPLDALALASDGRRWVLRGLGPLASRKKGATPLE